MEQGLLFLTEVDEHGQLLLKLAIHFVVYKCLCPYELVYFFADALKHGLLLVEPGGYA